MLLGGILGVLELFDVIKWIIARIETIRCYWVWYCVYWKYIMLLGGVMGVLEVFDVISWSI